MSTMTTSQPLVPHRALGPAALVVAALVFSFLAGRATHHAAAATPQAIPAAEARASAAPPPWAQAGFRDQETWRTQGRPPDANGN